MSIKIYDGFVRAAIDSWRDLSSRSDASHVKLRS